MVPLAHAAAACTANCYVGVLKQPGAQMRLSLAHDQGCEMADHKYLKQKTQDMAHLANRYSHCKRELTENLTGCCASVYQKVRT